MFLLVGDEAGFEVAAEGAFCADARTSEVGGADEGFATIDDDGFGVDSRAKDAFEEIAFDESGVAVEVFPETGAGFFGVEEADRNAGVDEVGEDFKKWDEAAFFFDMEVFDVGSDDPEEFLGTGKHVDDDALVDVFIEDEIGHRGGENTADSPDWTKKTPIREGRGLAVVRGHPCVGVSFACGEGEEGWC